MSTVINEQLDQVPNDKNEPHVVALIATRSLHRSLLKPPLENNLEYDRVRSGMSKQRDETSLYHLSHGQSVYGKNLLLYASIRLAQNGLCLC